MRLGRGIDVGPSIAQGTLLMPLQNKWLTMAALASLTTPAFAASDKIFFSIEGTKFSFFKPTDMCELKDLTSSPIITAISGVAGEVEVALSLCGEVQRRGLVVFSPDFGVPQEFDRESFLRGLASEYEKSDAPKYNQEMQDDISKIFHNETGKEISAKGTFGYRSRDLDCVYLEGRFQIINQEGKDKSKDIGACLTTVAGKIIFVYAYGDARTGGPSLTRQAHDIAMSLKPQDF